METKKEKIEGMKTDVMMLNGKKSNDMHVQRIHTKIVIVFFICLAILFNFVRVMFLYPSVEVDLSCTSVGSKVALFYCVDGEHYSDDKYLNSGIETSEKKTYHLAMQDDFDNIRLCFGEKEGQTIIYKFTIKNTFFSKCEVPLDVLMNSAGLLGEEVQYEDGVIRMQASSSGPSEIYLDISLVEEYRELDLSYFVELLMGSVILFLILYGGYRFEKHFDIRRKILEVLNCLISIGAKHSKNIGAVAFVVLFFSLPLLFTYDSSIYLQYVDFFNGELSWGEWGKTRGWGLPIFLWLASSIFGESSYGMQVAFFFIYLVYMCIAYKLIDVVSVKKKNRWIYILFIMLNPIILGYFHLVLTEAVAAMVCVVVIYVLLKRQDEYLNGKIKEIAYCTQVFAMVLVTSIYLYFLKQMFFVIPIIAFSISEIYLVVKRKEKLVRYFLLLISSLIILAISIKGWNLFIDNSKNAVQVAETETFQELNSSGNELISRYLVRGAVNFEWLAGEKQILVKCNDETIDCIKYEGELSSVGYWLKCLKSHPLLLMQGYIDNYLVLANLYTLEAQENYTMSIAKIKKEVSFTRGLENFALAEYPRWYDYELNTVEEMGNTETLKQYGVWTDGNVVTECLYDMTVLRIFNFLYTISILYAPFALMLHVILALKKETADHYHGKQAILSGTAFFYGCALSAMCMRIDRYAFPILIFALIVLILDVVCVIRYFGHKLLPRKI